MTVYTINPQTGDLKKDGSLIPQDDRTPEYQEYVAWLGLGNGPIEVQEPSMVRITVSAWKIRKALNHKGLRAAVETLVETTLDQDVKDGWNHATEFDSDHPMILSMRTGLNMTEVEMYAVFELAETL